MSTNFAVFMSQLVAQSPLLLAYCVGIVLCAIWWRRAPTAALLAMIGTVLMLFTSIVGGFLPTYLIQNRGATPVASLSTTLAIVSLVLTVVRALAYGLVFAAVFVQRPRDYAGGGFEVVQRGDFTASASRR